MGTIRALSGEDLAILGLESETVAGHTCKVLVLEEPVDPGRLRDAIASRLDRVPELSLRLSQVDGAMCWFPADVDLSKHVVGVAADAPLDEEGVLKAVSSAFERRLDRARPLWRLDVIGSLTGGGGALVWTVHHALADGSTVMKLGRETLWSHDDGPDGSPPRRTPSVPEARQAAHRRTEELLALAREAPHLWHHSPFSGRIDGRRAVAFASADLGKLRQAAATWCRATVNDAVLTVVGGGLRRWLEAHHDQLGPIRVKVPVSLHGSDTPGADEPGNRDSFFCLDVPVTPADPLARLEAVRKATRIRKAEHDAEHLDALMHELGAVSPRLREFADRVLSSPRAFALNVSNVPGPPRSVNVIGVPVDAMYSIAEIGQRHALRAAVVSYDGKLRFGLCADPTLVGDVGSLADEIEADAEQLVSLAGV